MNSMNKRIERIEARKRPRPKGAYIALISEDGSVNVSGRGIKFQFESREALHQWEVAQGFTGIELIIVDARRPQGAELISI